MLYFITDLCFMMPLRSKSIFTFCFLLIAAICVLCVYMYTERVSIPVPWSKRLPSCACETCLKDRHPATRMVIESSPSPFLSNTSTVQQEDYDWWRSIQFTPQDISYFKETVDKLFQIFPPTPEVAKHNPERCRACAVVGNSVNLARSHYGPLIDEHDFVIRMNQGRVKGYEEHVGTKTTHHVMYPESASNLAPTTHLVFFPFKIRDLEWLLRSFNPKNTSTNAVADKQPGKRGNKDLVMILNPAFMKYVHDIWLQKRDRYPSTGFMVVILSLVICDEVSVFGFGADGDGNWSHYFERLSNKRLRTGPHSGMLEYNVLKKLHKEKLIQLYRGT